jgi:hypothetical protein
MWGIVGYKKGYLVNIGVYFVRNMYWEGGLSKGCFEVFINI